MTFDPRFLAHSLVKHLGFRRPPIMVKRACRTLGIHVCITELDNDGYALDVFGRPYIFLSSKLPKTRLRWTAAHELGHLLLHHQCSIVHQTGKEHVERPAHVFAEEFLMPGQMLHKILQEQKSKCMKPLPEVLAKQFGVSCTAMEIRLKVSA